MKEDYQSILDLLQELNAKIEAIQEQANRIDLNKAAFTQKEIIQAMGLKGEHRGLLDYLKKSNILHSPISHNPLIYPGEIVRRAIKKVNAGKVAMPRKNSG